ncbi:hypothetical protein R6Q57_003430 [Mikania cordata]
MAKNQTGRNPLKSCCVKIRKATFGGYRRADPLVTSKARVPYDIPIEPAPSTNAKSAKNVRFSSNNATKKEPFTRDKELIDQKTFGESKFDSFIRRTKVKMGVSSDVSAVKKVSRRDTFSEKVSNFIDHAKLKFRATSSIGANGKSVAFKPDH